MNGKKFILIISFPVSIILITYGSYEINKLDKNIFRLSSTQVIHILTTENSSCGTLDKCKLVPGDILLRRYITKRTWLMDKLARPYFTHAAMYLGNNQIVEAVGTENNPEDDIQVANLTNSDWLNFDMSDWVVVRPKNIGTSMNLIEKNLRSIASDPEYKFGLPEQGLKRTTCSKLIVDQLVLGGIVSTENMPTMITPDYIFYMTQNPMSGLDIIGFSNPL